MMITGEKKGDGSVTLHISGRFSFACYADFHAAISETSTPRYTIDLSEAEYLDSSALGMLLLLRERVGNDASRVSISGAKGQPSEVLKLANFGRLFTIV
jgi:anti-anti-sigma factor